jgi:hypothetical protein
LKLTRARFRGQESRNLRVRDSDGRPGTPKLSGLDVVERPACGIRPVSGAGRSRIATGGRGALEGQSQRRFDHAQSVNVRPRRALRGAHSCSTPRHFGYGSGASRPAPFLTDNARTGQIERSSGKFQVQVLFAQNDNMIPCDGLTQSSLAKALACRSHPVTCGDRRATNTRHQNVESRLSRFAILTSSNGCDGIATSRGPLALLQLEAP